MNDLYFECSSGISGDMAVAALLDLGADKLALQNALDSVPTQGFKTEITRVNKSGIDCCDFNVILDSEHENHDHDMQYLFGHDAEQSHSEKDQHHSSEEQGIILSEDNRHSERSEESVDDKMFRFAQHDAKLVQDDENIAQDDKGVILSEEQGVILNEDNRHSERSEESVDGEMFRFAQHDAKLVQDDKNIAQHDKNFAQQDENAEKICYSDEDSRHSERSEESVNDKMFRFAQHDEKSVQHDANFAQHDKNFAQHDEKSVQYDENFSQLNGLVHKDSILFTEKQDSTNAKAFIYILTNFNKTTLYVGVTSDLKRRIYEHKNHLLEGFTNKYNCEILVYFECFEDIKTAIEREKYVKGKKRDFKENLINSINPNWQDLYDYIFRDVSASPQHDKFVEKISHSSEEQDVILSEEQDVILNEDNRHSERSEESVDDKMFRFAQHDANFAQDDKGVILSEAKNLLMERCFANAQHDIKLVQHDEKSVQYDVNQHNGASSEHHHSEHEHHHEHRNLSDVLEIIDKTQMTSAAKKLAHKIFEIIAYSESKAHNLPLDKVHFHEVGAIDSIVDVIAFAVCFDSLKINRVFVPILNEGTGTVRCQHGILPIPVPAVANIVQKYELPLHIMAEKGEFITPTGAAFVAAVMTDKVLPSMFTIKKIGLGSGKRTYERPSILRAFLIEETMNNRCFADAQHDGNNPLQHDDFSKKTATNSSETLSSASEVATNSSEVKSIIKLETNIDDCTSETLGFVMEKLFEQGALEVNYIPCFMKKNRPAYLLSVICTENSRSKLEEIIFKNTTTIGIRRSCMQRTILNRKELELDSPYGKIRAKEVWGFGVKRILPEYDDVAKIAQETEKSFLEIYSELADLCKLH